MIERALGMPNRLKKQLTYVEQDPNIALNCNKIQILNKKERYRCLIFKYAA